MKTQPVEMNLMQFANEYAYGFNKFKKEFTKIELFDHQKKMLKHLELNKLSIIKKPRQFGENLITSIFLSHYVISNENKSICIVSNTVECAKHILDTIKFILEKCEEKLVNDRVGFIKLKNGSSIEVKPANKNAFRAKSYDLIYLNEYAFINKIKTIDLLPYLKENNRVIISSTPKIGDTKFRNIFTEAELNNNMFSVFNANREQNELINEEDYEKYCATLLYNDQEILMELHGEFVESDKIQKPERKMSMLNIRITNENKKNIIKKAKENGYSTISDYIMNLLDRELDN